MGGANSGEVGFDHMYISASRFTDQTVVLVLDMSREYCHATRSLDISIRSFFADSEISVISAGAQINTVIANPRVLLGCFYRCFCTYGLANPSVQPKAAHGLFQTVEQRSHRTYELQPDIEDDSTTPRAQKNGKSGTTKVDSVIVQACSQIGQTLGDARNLPLQIISLDPGNKIECRGNLPTFNLPSPYSTRLQILQVCRTCA